MASPTRARFKQHDGIAYNGMEVVLDTADDAAAGVGLGLGVRGSAFGARQLAVSNPSKALPIATLHSLQVVGIAPAAGGSSLRVLQPKPRNGASVHKVIQVARSPDDHGCRSSPLPLNHSAIAQSVTIASGGGSLVMGAVAGGGTVAVAAAVQASPSASVGVKSPLLASGPRRVESVEASEALPVGSGAAPKPAAVTASGSRTGRLRPLQFKPPEVAGVARLRSVHAASVSAVKSASPSARETSAPVGPPSPSRRAAAKAEAIEFISAVKGGGAAGAGAGSGLAKAHGRGNSKLTAASIRALSTEPKGKLVFGQRVAVEVTPCVCILMFRIWREGRAAARARNKELQALINNPVFLDGPAGHIAGLCGLTKPQIQLMGQKFHLELNRDESGSVTAHSFLDWVNQPVSVFTRTVFKLICDNLTLAGEMKRFEDFLVAMITFCMFSPSDLLRMIFNSIDADESGSLSEEEYRALLIMITTGEGASFPGSYKKMLVVADRDKDGAIQFEEFLFLSQKFPLAMFPLFKLQIEVQNATLGQDAWMSVKRRVDMVLETQEAMKASGVPAD